MDYLPGGSPHIPARGRERFLPRHQSRWFTSLLSIFAIILAVAPQPAWAAGEKATLPPLGGDEMLILGIALVVAIISVLYAFLMRRKIQALDPGTPAMQEVSAAIKQGALAYLKQQVKMMVWFVAVLFVVLVVTSPERVGRLDLAIGIGVAFLLGVAASYIAGYIGMMMSVDGNTRTAHAALSSFNGALQTAFRSGSVAGMATVGLGLLGATVIFWIYQEDAMKVLIGFGFGGSLAALFMRVGGGIFTKAADVGADLVGKLEKGIPEDDPRNAATIADNVGDNVGDCAGMAADIFESYEVTLVAAIILGVAVNAARTALGDPILPDAFVIKLAVFPFLVRAVGIIASIIGVYFVRADDSREIDPMKPIETGFNVSAIIAVVGTFLVAGWYMKPIAGMTGVAADWWRYPAAVLMGIVLAFVIQKVTAYYTDIDGKPVREIAAASQTGAATLILSGFSEGLESAWWGVIAIGATMLASMALFGGDIAMAMYGIALAGLGLLTTTGYILAEDTFGPIADNANGIFEMSGELKKAEARGNTQAQRIIARLDAVGNTTKALTKGFAIATAVIAAVSLFSAFLAETDLQQIGIKINLPIVFVGFLVGSGVPYLFCAMAIRAVSRAAILLVEEVRRQFREIPGIMEGLNKPDYDRCVSIATTAAQKELLGPAVLAIAAPVLVAFGLGFNGPQEGAMALGGFFAGLIASGQLLAVLLSNSGAAWDNAKKLIEDGAYGGKGSEAHKAGIIGDTVGDPFKDTAGPALNPMIKVMNLVGLLIAPMVITDISMVTRVVIVVVSAGALIGAIAFSQRRPEASSAPAGEEPAEAAPELAQVLPQGSADEAQAVEEPEETTPPTDTSTD